MIEVIRPGLETTVQDYPGRVGYRNQGFPTSGPMDSWSFRLANILVGNPAGEAGLECQFVGPTLQFHVDTVIAVCGAFNQPVLDETPLPLWESIAVKAGQILKTSFATSGARTYIAISGGIRTELLQGSRATFHRGGVGGVQGHAIQTGQSIPIGAVTGVPVRVVKEACRPKFAFDRRWSIEVMRGPNDDWIDEQGHEIFLTSNWKLSSMSDRIGYRIVGPSWRFSEKAIQKRPEHGSEPSNIIDQGYPLGAINVTGQTTTILLNDSPGMGGHINPYTVVSAALWKLGQSKPGDILQFTAVSLQQANELRHNLNALCNENSIV